MKNPVMYIFVNKGLGMSTGKTAAQVGHAVGRSFRSAFSDPDTFVELEEYMNKGETKIVLECRDTEHLLMTERYLAEKGFKTHLVIDEGRTEIDPHTPTVLASDVVDKADEKVQFAFGDFKTYKDPKPVEPRRRKKLGHLL